MSKEKFVPELRFPELVSAGEWEYENGDELFEPILNKNHNSDLPILAITQEQGAIPRDLIDYHVSVTEKSVESYKVVEVGDFIISLRSFQGGIEYSNYLGLCSPAYIILRKKRDLISDFYRHYFKSFLFIQDLNRNLEGIRDGKMISYKQFSEILIPNPKKEEQQKIASCLSSLDELIAAHNEKLDALKDHKKGLMQNLFPQEGETVPKVRFKEFEDDGDWVEKSLIETTNSKIKWSFTGGPFGSNLKASDYTSEGIRIIQLQNIGDGEFHNDNKIYTSLEKADELLSCNIYAGDIIISKMGDPVGRACLIPNKLQRCVMASDGIRFVVDENKHSKYFIYSLLNSKRIRQAIESKSTGSTRKRIGLDALRETELIIPKNLKEQQKIASCLLAVDELITAQAEKIEQLQQHKKGLMQGLFPKIES